MREAQKPRIRSAQGISAGLVPSPRWITALPDPLAYGDDVRLTTDERITLSGLARGMTMREIQARLDVGYSVVQRHRSSIHRKLGARNDAHSVLIGIRRKELE